jgi:hypothetical protein
MFYYFQPRNVLHAVGREVTLLPNDYCFVVSVRNDDVRQDWQPLTFE